MRALIAIVGRPNVGKSTLFNRFVGGRPALVADVSGLTRDRHYGTMNLMGRSVSVVDTGGFEPDNQDSIMTMVRHQAEMAIAEADVVLFVWDARVGLTPVDRELVQRLRKSQRPVLYVANKVDTVKQDSLALEGYATGSEQIYAMSAETGRGFEELQEALAAALPPVDLTQHPDPDDPSTKPIRVALIGRPNAGKSALLNALIGQQRAIVSPIAGTTRDPVDTAFRVGEDHYVIVDTAGIRKKARLDEDLEKLSVLKALRCIEDADVVCLVVDSAGDQSVQDAKLARLAMDAGRGLVFVLNKADKSPAGKPGAESKQFVANFCEPLSFAAFAPVICLSAQTGWHVDKLLPTVKRVFGQCNRRISTSELNRFLATSSNKHPLPAYRGHSVKLFYMTQPAVCPPTFVFHASHVEGITDAYRRYLANGLRQAYRFEGAPIRMRFLARTSKV